MKKKEPSISNDTFFVRTKIIHIRTNEIHAHASHQVDIQFVDKKYKTDECTV